MSKDAVMVVREKSMRMAEKWIWDVSVMAWDWNRTFCGLMSPCTMVPSHALYHEWNALVIATAMALARMCFGCSVLRKTEHAMG